MSFQTDRIQAMRGRTWFTAGVGAPILTLTLLWAIRPSPIQPLRQPVSAEASAVIQTTAAQRPAIDPAAFDVDLWHEPPVVVAASVAAQAPALVPLRVQLLGIVKENGRHLAALYDMEADQIIFVAPGDQVHHHRVVEITMDTVELSDGQATQRLTIRQEAS